MGWLCDKAAEAGVSVIADFVCPTPETRKAFGEAFVVFVDRVKVSRYEDTNLLFVRPYYCDVRVGAEGDPNYWANVIVDLLQDGASKKNPSDS